MSGRLFLYSDLKRLGYICPTSEMSTYLATERTTSVNSIFELSNLTIPKITGSLTPTFDISVSPTSFLYIGTTNIHAHTEFTNLYSNTVPTHFYMKTETTNSYADTETTSLNANIETTNVYANTETNEIQTKTLGIISNILSNYNSAFVKTAADDFSGSFDTVSQFMTEILALPVYSISPYNRTTLLSTFETSNVFPRTLFKTLISFSVDTSSDKSFQTSRVSSGSVITTDSFKYSILSSTISSSYGSNSYNASLSTDFYVTGSVPIIPGSAFEITNVSPLKTISWTIQTGQTLPTTTTIASNANSGKSMFISGHIQQIINITESTLISSTSVYDQDSFSSELSNPTVSSYQNIVILKNHSIINGLPSSMIDTIKRFKNTTQILNNPYQEETYVSMDDFTFTQDYAAPGSTSFGKFSQSINHHLSLQITDDHATIQAEFKPILTSSFYELNTNNATKEDFSSEIVSSRQLDMFESSNPSDTKLGSMTGIESTPYSHSNTLEPYFRSTNDILSSEMSEYVLSTIQSTSFLLPFITNSYAPEVDSSMMTTNRLISETQIGMLSISTVLSDFETTWHMTTTNLYNEATLSTLIKPSSQQTNTEHSNFEISTTSIDEFFSSSSFVELRTSNYTIMTTLSTQYTSTIQSGISEKEKTIIFISTTSAVVTIIIVIVLIVFNRMYMSKHNRKPRTIDDNISNITHSPNTAFNYPFTGKSIHPLLNTCSTSFKMHPYEHNWNDIV